MLTSLLDRTGVDPAAVDDVVFGCVDQVGAQSGNLARTAWLAGGLPESVPGTTLDRQCGSSQQAIHSAAQAVMSGTQDPVVAAWTKDTGASWERTNVNGGAMALGHPLGATGGKLMATLVQALERREGRYGLQVMCEGGGMANATIIERV